MKNITMKFLKAGAFTCLAACAASVNAAEYQVQLKNYDNTPLIGARVSVLTPGSQSFVYKGSTNELGQLQVALGYGSTQDLGTYVLQIIAGNSTILDTFNVVSPTDVKVVDKKAVDKYVVFRNSQNVPYSDQVISVKGLHAPQRAASTTNAEGVSHYTTIFEGSKFVVIFKFKGQEFTQEFNANDSDSFYINTLPVNVHWPHTIARVGTRDVFSAGNIKTIEALPGVLGVQLTSNVNGERISSTHDIQVTNNSSSINITPIRFILKNSEGVMGDELESARIRFKKSGDTKFNLVEGNTVNGHITLISEGDLTATQLITRADHQGVVSEKTDINLLAVQNIVNYQTSNVTIHWPHTLKYGGATGNSYVLNGDVKSFESLPGTMFVNFTSTNNNRTPITKVNTKIALEVGESNIEKTAIQLRFLNQNGSNKVITGSYSVDGDVSKSFTNQQNVIELLDGDVRYDEISVDLNDGLTSRNITSFLTDSEHIYDFMDETPVSDMLTLNTNVNVYPNPATDYIQVKMDAAQGEVYIYNTVGQLVYNNSNVANNETINVSSLPTGAYNVVIVANDKKETVRVIKN